MYSMGKEQKLQFQNLLRCDLDFLVLNLDPETLLQTFFREQQLLNIDRMQLH